MTSATATKTDLYKEHKQEYITPKKPMLVRVERAKYLSATGQGEPGGALFQAMVGALYGTAYTIKFAKKPGGHDFKVCNLEGLYWTDSEYQCFTGAPPAKLHWRLLIRVPGYVTQRDLDAAVRAKRETAPEMAEVKLETIKEGKSVQMLHVGPYAEEPKTIRLMIDFAAAQGLQVQGPHHEIYLSDPHRVPPERLKTILRLPVGEARKAPDQAARYFAM